MFEFHRLRYVVPHQLGPARYAPVYLSRVNKSVALQSTLHGHSWKSNVTSTRDLIVPILMHLLTIPLRVKKAQAATSTESCRQSRATSFLLKTLSIVATVSHYARQSILSCSVCPATLFCKHPAQSRSLTRFRLTLHFRQDVTCR